MYSRGEDVLRAGDLQIRRQASMALVRGRPLTLTVHELALLTALVERTDQIVTREELYAAAWGRELRDNDRSVDVYVRRLRKKLALALPAWRFIHTHMGFGYRLSPEPSPEVHSNVTTR